MAKLPKSCLSTRMLEEIRRRAKSAESKTELVDLIFATIVDHRVDPGKLSSEQWKQIVVAAAAAAPSHASADPIHVPGSSDKTGSA